jgi:hemerythrin-like domain-containing protein
MNSISQYMSQQHRACDELFAQAKTAVGKQQWPLAEQHWLAFCAELEWHLSTEETILFPAFERATGMSAGPTQVMRLEHQQMRGLVMDISTALSKQQADEFLATSETLMVLMQQHTMKEEMILYPMSEQQIDNSTALAQTLQQFPSSPIVFR